MEKSELQLVAILDSPHTIAHRMYHVHVLAVHCNYASTLCRFRDIST